MKKLTVEQRDFILKVFTEATEEARSVQWDWFENILNANTEREDKKPCAECQGIGEIFDETTEWDEHTHGYFRNCPKCRR